MLLGPRVHRNIGEMVRQALVGLTVTSDQVRPGAAHQPAAAGQGGGEHTVHPQDQGQVGRGARD